MGAALLLAILGMSTRAMVALLRGAPAVDDAVVPPVRRLPTLLVGVLGGVMVGMTSVGSGSLMIVLLMLLYPSLSMRRLVGTDLVQAIPLVGSAALGQLIFGDFRLGLTTSLLIGSLPGVYLGARMSAVATGHWRLGALSTGHRDGRIGGQTARRRRRHRRRRARGRDRRLARIDVGRAVQPSARP